jgi:energy-coupling factor transport system ATP-binding protein
MSIESVVKVKDLSFKYKDQTDGKALNNINLDIDKGEFLLIMGPSGAGKSTLANCLNGLVPHFSRGKYEGSVEVYDMNAKESGVSTMSRKIGLVFQDFESQLFSTNTRLEIAFGPENFQVPREEIHEAIDYMFELVDLKGMENRQPSTLSGGQKQRLAIGSVLSTYPKIVCMDEPTTDLDPIGKIGIFNIADKLCGDEDFTLIIIEHETEESLNADRLIFMKDGEIIRDGNPRELLKEVELMDEMGIMSLQIPKFFHEMYHIEKDSLPLTPAEGLVKFNEMDLAIDSEKHLSIVEKDIELIDSYGEVLIEVEGLEHEYGNGNKALKGIDLTIKDGEFLAILGHNGSGKTTLVKHFNGLLQPTGGSVTVKGKGTLETSIFEIGTHVGYVFQNPDHQIFSDTVYEEVAFSPKIRGCNEEEIEIRVKEALEAVGMTGFEEEDPFMMTKGQRQRIAVASVLSARPEVIILDEPTTGLDYKEQKQMMELVKKLNEAGHTIVMITHTMWVVSEYAHRVAVIKDGKMSMYGSTREVFSKDDELQASSLKTPHIVNMSNQIGSTVLSIDELKNCVRGM